MVGTAALCTLETSSPWSIVCCTGCMWQSRNFLRRRRVSRLSRSHESRNSVEKRRGSTSTFTVVQLRTSARLIPHSDSARPQPDSPRRKSSRNFLVPPGCTLMISPRGVPVYYSSIHDRPRETMILTVPSPVHRLWTENRRTVTVPALRLRRTHIDVREIYNERSRAEDAKRSQAPQ